MQPLSHPQSNTHDMTSNMKHETHDPKHSTLSTHPFNPFSQYILSTHPLDSLSQHILSIHSLFNFLFQHTLSTYPLNAPISTHTFTFTLTPTSASTLASTRVKLTRKQRPKKQKWKKPLLQSRVIRNPLLMMNYESTSRDENRDEIIKYE